MARPDIFFDAGRLIEHFNRTTPTGIDRVELAYAKEFRRRFGSRVVYGYSLWGRVIPISDDRVDDFLAATEQSWRAEGTEKTSTAMTMLTERLGVVFPPTTLETVRVRTNAERSTIFVDLTMGGIRTAVPKLSRFLPRAGDTFVGVAHMGLQKDGPVRRMVGRAGIRPVFLLHDLIPITHPEYAVATAEAKHHDRVETILRHGELLITNSDDTRMAAERYAGQRGIRMPEAVVAHLGLEPVWLQPIEPVVAAEPYFLTVGTIEPRKNHLLLLNVWRRLVQRHGAAAPKLVVVGRRGWENEQVVDMLERSRDIQDHVIECSDLPDAALKSLMAGARALLFPSFVEGYGLPLAEAMAARLPVIASNIGVFRELAGIGPDYLDPLDGLGWLAAIEDYVDPDSRRRAAQIERLRLWRAPTWEGHFQTVMDVLERRRLV
ncbi:glycosyltransferase family 4 protein [Oharaeibacter diazotrophicus]|uniref:Glycosyltransferase involved in cell wall biosynthesis n=1 Tax=Oharaeibacter diazotrophicus TaxID=1920512 RepID=A0A4R6R851_9HYPH|nr:glycosyltransferase family 1 protein [Oharaeibacter diazotrophicus]TDP82034.1 glycosyltransferase involved in cell wall biosynthesis [Oharaeibacter diazotrophicus]BBE73666.1 D-inositol-3-phosphate glycosyltransferase [Pleomorphomonas sp. SM30]GLS75455.1 glycosyl transferase [Oharaeibacter diazotrophicus]